MGFGMGGSGGLSSGLRIEATAGLDALPPPPAWLPAAGSSANIHTTSLSAVNSCPPDNCWYSQTGKQAAPWMNWSGAVYAADFGEYGAMLYQGGGHLGGVDHTIYCCDLGTGAWSRIGPLPPAANYAGSDGESELDADWYDYLHEGSYIIPAVHNYNYAAYIPASYPGAGAKGSWLLTALNAGPRASTAPHAVDLVTGAWTRATSTRDATTVNAYSGAFVDTTRGKVWFAGYNSNLNFSIDLNATPRTLTKYVSGAIRGGWYGCIRYLEEFDMAVDIFCEYAQVDPQIKLYDMSSGSPVELSVNAIPARDVGGAGVGWDWCPITQKFYLYNGNGSTTVHVLTPSSTNLSTCTWSWSSETFSDPAWRPADAAGYGSQPMSRWTYIPRLRCFAWAGGPYVDGLDRNGALNDGIMQLWRPLGT